MQAMTNMQQTKQAGFNQKTVSWFIYLLSLIC
jgi:hypothetical protein